MAVFVFCAFGAAPIPAGAAFACCPVSCVPGAVPGAFGAAAGTIESVGEPLSAGVTERSLFPVGLLFAATAGGRCGTAGTVASFPLELLSELLLDAPNPVEPEFRDEF